ncbi:MAG: BatA and WFA domain-containing protein [Candidatus Coproplasma sp.]
MRFSNPLGFLALLAIPVIIIIYIIKSKYTEQTITSTYLWTLSERFLKRKNPLKAITGLISLILQLLAVLFIALAISGPVFILKGKAYDYCFILDASASMNATNNGTSRFEEGKDNIERLISSSADGSSYTLIVAGDTTDVIFKGIDDKKSAINQLNALSSSFSSSNLNSALTQAQKYFNSNKSIKFYVVTDKEFETTANVSYIGVNGGTVNYAIDEIDYLFLDGGMKITGKAVSYSGDSAVTVEAYINDSPVPSGTATVQVTENTFTSFTIQLSETDFNSLKVKLKSGDNLDYDNQVILYNKRSSDSYSTLLVSNTPFLIQAAIKSAGNLSCDVISPEEYTEAKATGYSLYIFDSDDGDAFSPEVLPSDGAVWFINPSASVAGSGFSYRGVAEGATQGKLSTSTETEIRSLLKGTADNSETSFLKYVRCRPDKNFYPLMYCGDDDPIVFAGANDYGNREVVFAFDFNYSDFSTSYNGLVLLSNLINYTFPSVLEETVAYSGDTVTFNVLPGCNSIKVTAPSGKEEYVYTSDTVSETICEYQLSEVGEYAVSATVGNGIQTAYMYSCFPTEERILQVKETSFVIEGEAETNKRDGKYDDVLYLFIILAVLFIADWAVYCYEQYQLR